MLVLIRLCLSFLRAIFKWLFSFFPVFFKRLSAWSSGFLTAMLPGLLVSIKQLFSGLAKYMLGVAAIFVAMTAFISAIHFILGGLIRMSVPADLIQIGAMFLPSNLSACISVLIVARIKSLVFFWVSKLSSEMAKA
ncbi:MAG: hypothetical protein V7756_05220 [Halopseudomonas sp.]|uniref:hypothetical protein n=1 Tax=Halopseudomonas sp. TaxID=2901191 RepID=UPI0030026C72